MWAGLRTISENATTVGLFFIDQDFEVNLISLKSNTKKQTPFWCVGTNFTT